MKTQKGFAVISTFFVALLVFIGAYALLDNQGGEKLYDIKNMFETGKDSIINSNAKPISNVSSSKVVNLSNQGLQSIPSSVFSETNAEELNVSNNNLTGSIQSQIGNLKNLRILNASNNSMTGVPAEIGQLQKLETLDLSNNQLTGLPNELGNLKNLKVLNLSGNSYAEQDLKTIRDGLSSDVMIIVN